MRRPANARAFRIRFIQFLALAAFFFGLDAAFSEETVPTLLTNAADVLSLPETLARKKIPVRIRGIVTAAESGWSGQFIVQDETSGVFVENRSDRYPKPGDVVEVTGFTWSGSFAPIISKPT
jgi:hypothetical protein